MQLPWLEIIGLFQLLEILARDHNHMSLMDYSDPVVSTRAIRHDGHHESVLLQTYTESKWDCTDNVVAGMD